MINFSLSPEQEMIRDMSRDFARNELSSGVLDRDKHSIFPYEQIKKMGELGMMGMMVPNKWGGAGLETISYVLAIEEISAVELATSTIMSVNNSLVCQVLLDWGSENQKEIFLKPLAKGDKLGAYSLSEPQSGSDASNMKTFAEKDGDNYIINGSKNWVTSGINSDLVILFCLTEKGIGSKGVSCFVIEKEVPGLIVGKKEEKLGIRASDTSELFFENCKIPKSNRIGNEGEGFSIAMNVLSGGRIGIGAQAVGLARSSLEKSVLYAKDRKQFGKSIGEFGAIQNKLANMATKIDAARLLVWQAAFLKDKGEKHVKQSSMAKLFASSVAVEAASDCIQIHGGYGYIHEYGVERLIRDAKITEIYEGTSEIQKLVISRELLK